MMDNRDLLVASLTQMIAPRLFVLAGDDPAKMGFPIGDDEADFEQRLARQFDPVAFWTERAKEIAEGVVTTMEAGGDLTHLNIDAVISRSAEYGEEWQPN